MLVVNLFGAPGAGKSTGAAYVFSQLKLKNINCELVTEFAKDKVWEEARKAFKDQLYLFGNQHYKLRCCEDKVDCVITDSPLLLSNLFNNNIHSSHFSNLVYDEFKSFNNINFFIQRVKKYQPIGRFQTEKESDNLANDLRDLLASYNVTYFNIDGNLKGYDKLVNIVTKVLNHESNSN